MGSSWKIAVDEDAGYSTFQIDCSDWNTITDEPIGEQDCGVLLFQHASSTDGFGLVLTIVDFRLHATIVSNLRKGDCAQLFKAKRLESCQ